MRLKYLAIVMALLLTLLTPLNAYTPDPSPLLELLKDVLRSYSEGNYALSSRLVDTALSIELPNDVSYVHRSTYLRLRDLINLTATSKSLDDTANSTYLRSLIYGLSRSYNDLNVSITTYLNTLSKYFKDIRLRDVYLSEVRGALELAYSELDNTLNELIVKYLGIAFKLINVSITMPEVIYGGSDYFVWVYVSAPNEVKYVDLMLLINYGGIYTYLSTSIPANEGVTINLKAPSAEEFVERGVKPGLELSYEVLVRAITSLNGSNYVGQAASRGILRFLSPNVVVTPYLSGNELKSVVIKSVLDYPLNTSIYLDDLLVSSLEIFNGSYDVSLNVELTPGKHLLKVVIDGRGYYLGKSLTHELVVGLIPVNAYVDASWISLGPPFNTVINLHVDIVPYTLKVFLANDLVLEDLINSSTKSLTITLPWTTALWCDVTLVVEPFDGRYSTSSKSIRIYVINVPLITATSLTTLTLITNSSVRRRVKHLKHLTTYLPRFLTLKSNEGSPGVEAGMSSGILLRRPRLSRLYRRLVRLISKFAEPPRRYETLREFLLRVKGIVNERIYGLVASFIASYELDLYSTHVVDEVEARNTLRRLEEVVK